MKMKSVLIRKWLKESLAPKVKPAQRTQALKFAKVLEDDGDMADASMDVAANDDDTEADADPSELVDDLFEKLCLKAIRGGGTPEEIGAKVTEILQHKDAIKDGTDAATDTAGGADGGGDAAATPERLNLDRRLSALERDKVIVSTCERFKLDPKKLKPAQVAKLQKITDNEILATVVESYAIAMAPAPRSIGGGLVGAGHEDDTSNNPYTKATVTEMADLLQK